MSERFAATFSWSAHPARERPRQAILSALAITALAVAAGRLGQHPGWSLLAALVLVAALNRFFFPSRFTIDANGITARYPLGRRRLEWHRLRRFLHDARGGYLSTRATASRLDAYRGTHLLFGSSRARVVELIQARIAAPALEQVSINREGTPCAG